jgi:hypothetical protein
MGAFTYPRSEPGSSGHLDLVERLNAQVARLRDALNDIPEDSPPNDGWSSREIVGHLCDVSRIVHGRLARMIKLEEPRLEAYDPDDLAAARNAGSARIDDLLAEYAAQRAETVEMLSDLVHWNWARPGRHPTLGRISIRQQVEQWIEHEEEHFEQIRSLRRDGAVQPND